MASGRIRGITIELSSDTKGLVKGLNDAKKQVSGVQKALQDVEKLLKLDPGNTELLAQKHKLLGDEVKGLKDKLAAAEEAMKGFQDAGDDENSIRAQEALTREIEETKKALEDATKEYERFGSVGSQKVAAAGQKLKEFGGKLSDAGEELTKKVTVPLVGLGTAAVKVGSDFESAMSQVEATLGSAAGESVNYNGQTLTALEAINAEAQKLGATTAFSAKDAADGFNVLLMAGYSANDAIAALAPTMDLASAGALDLASAANYTTGIMSGFGMASDETVIVADKLVKMSQSAKGSVQDFGEALATSAGMAKTTGQDFDEAAVALEILGNHNLSASEAGNALSRTLKNLYQPTDAAAKTMAELGVSSYYTAEQAADFNAQMEAMGSDLRVTEGDARPMHEVLQQLNDSMAGWSQEAKNQYLSQIFDSATLKSVPFLMNDIETSWESLAAGLEGSSGSAADTAATQLDNLQGSLTYLKSALEGAAIAINDTLGPMVRQAADFITNLVTKFNELDPSTKDMIVKIGMVIAAVGPLLLVIGKVLVLVGQVMTFAPMISAALAGIAGPIGIAIAAIAALIAAGVWLYNHWEEVKEWCSQTWGAIKDFLVGLWDGIKQKAVEIWEGIKTAVVTPIENAKQKLEQTWENIKTTVSGKWESMKQTASSVWESIKTAITQPIEDAKQKVHDAIEKIKGFFNFSWELPSLKLPHFSVSGKFSLNPPQIPHFSVDWYAKAMQGGMILDSPTIFGAMGGHLLGAGEAGPEAVVGTGSLQSMISSAVGGGIDPAAIYQAVKEGASAATVKAYMDGRAITAEINRHNTTASNGVLRFMGV